MKQPTHARPDTAAAAPAPDPRDTAQPRPAPANAGGPVVVARPEGGGPIGRRLAGNLGPGILFPGVGKMVQRTQQPYYCGVITGLVFGYVEHPNSKDPKRTSTRFAGQFLLVNWRGQVIQGYECYLPGTVERAVKAALKIRGDAGGEPIKVSIEVWCEPDDPSRSGSPLGYSYITYDRAAQRDADPLLAMAYETGILDRPVGSEVGRQAMLTAATAGAGAYDPETGEVMPDDVKAPASKAAQD